MVKHRTFSQPIVVAAEHGEVLLDGPNGIVASLTPDAAEASAQRLSEAARIARSQNDKPKD